uniref:Aminopeptidase NAALADL1 n=1 Tax=Gouania willdenowi TaxID=441366 RepID=A0A8C5HNP5_GOUWI
MIKTVLVGLVCGAVALTLGVLIGHFGITNNSSSAPSWINDIGKDVDENIVEKFLSEVDRLNIEENLRELTKVPHLATSEGDEQTVQFMLKRWQDPESGLDKAWREEYEVYLSFPDAKNPNKVTVGESFLEKEKNYTKDQEDPDIVQPYAAYSPAGQPKGKLVYANQGKPSDYELLNRTVDLRGTIAITRYGGAGRGAKAINAAPYGVIGVLVYTDPLDINDGLMSDINETYPHSWYLPPSGVERGAFGSQYGDMLTPYLAAKEETYRIPFKNVTGVPPIPIQPIGFEDAYRLICELGGEGAPTEWKGAFNCTYNFGGPGFKPESAFNNSDVKMAIFNQDVIKNSSNVMGVIRGSVEPDRYVIYGNHRDSWVHGAIDPSSGTSVMLELSRVLGKMVKEGKWRPRRSIIFGSWGAEEFGLIGSAEYTEQYFTMLSERTIAYINVDIAVFANATLRASAMPSLQNILFTATRQVSAPGLDSTSVYDNWVQFSNRTSPTHGLGKKIKKSQTSHLFPQSKTNARIYPAYHTAYDTFHYASNFIDPGFFSHQAVARTAGNVLIRLADSLVLPLNCSDYAESLEDYLNKAVDLYQEKLSSRNISMGRSLLEFKSTFSSFGFLCFSPEPLKVRRINDQLMLLDRAFLNPLAFPDKYAYRHVIWASSSANVGTFPGLADAFAKADSSGQTGDWEKVHHHMSMLSQAIDGAAGMLENVI